MGHAKKFVYSFCASFRFCAAAVSGVNHAPPAFQGKAAAAPRAAGTAAAGQANPSQVMRAPDPLQRAWYTAAMKFRRALFWDTDPRTLDVRRHATYVIERIADFGTAAEIRWAIRSYGLRRFREVVRTSRATLEPTKRLWLHVLGPGKRTR